MSVKCEEPLDELTVQVWLLHLHPILTLIIELCLYVGRNYGQTDRRTNNQITRCPRQPFRPGA